MSEPPLPLTKLQKAIGQMFMVGFSGHEVTPQIRELIEKYHVGSIILSVKNLRDAESTRSLISELQKIAHEAGHERPLLIAIDQENGMLNNLHDERYLSQFPGQMAMVATKSTAMVRDVARATGLELKSLGINWLLGPVLDVLTNSSNRLLGVRTMGDDPQEVTKFGLAYIEGYTSAGISLCGKHFPGYGNATVDSILGLPIVPETIEQLETASLIPFRQAVKANIDSIMVGGCALPKIAMNEMHACLSERVVRELLREDMGLEGVIMSECLEMDALYENVGVRQGAVMAAVAGCDVILVCSSYRLQQEAVSGIVGAVQNGILEENAIFKAAQRVAVMKDRHLSWQEALNPPPLSYLRQLRHQHLALSKEAYEHSIAVIRDHAHYIPLVNCVEPDADILLLTPLVTPLISTKQSKELDHLLLGETVFQEFGRSLARLHTGKVLHASYTANGLMAMHDTLIERAKAIIVVTTDANRNMYQVGFTKHVSVICNQHSKPVIAIAASSPYDLALDRAIGTYVCAYEFTTAALDTVAKILFGELQAKGEFPGYRPYQRRSRLDSSSGGAEEGGSARTSRNKWLVEKWTPERDLKRLKLFWDNSFPERRLCPGVEAFSLLCSSMTKINGADVSSNLEQTHFVVGNSSTNNLYGFCATWVHPATEVGCISMIFVEPSRRGMSIGRSLHDRALKYLIQERKVKRIQLGSAIPSFFPGVPVDQSLSNTLQWFKHVGGWDIDLNEAHSIIKKSGTLNTASNTGAVMDSGAATRASSPVSSTGRKMSLRYTMILTELQQWAPSRKLISELEMIGIKFDICQPQDVRMSQVFSLVEGHHVQVEGLRELYNEARDNAKIIVALDPVKRSVVGSIILFTRSSTLAGYMPWILEFVDARVGGLCGLVTDPMYKDLTNIFTLGLVACGARQFKLQGYERCVIDGVGEYQSRIYGDNGFRTLRRFLRISNSADNWA